MPSRYADSKLNVLVAWPYCTELYLKVWSENRSLINVFVDSGAFTAWKAGDVLDVDEYCDWIEALKPQPERYFTLDVIGDSEGTRKNYERMLERGLSPIPIFTRGEDVSELDRYYETSDLVAIGGLVGTKGNKGFVKGIMRYVGDRKVHWLGFTRFGFIQGFKPYSVDSSNFSMGYRYGFVPIYMGRGKMISLMRKDFVKRPSDEVCRAIRFHGVDPRELTQEKHWSRVSHKGDLAIERLCSRANVLWALDMKRKYGTRVFVAISSCDGGFELVMAVNALNFWRDL
jgi:hypothetical protein